MLLMIDNYDSFTYNIVQYFSQLRQQVNTYKNDQINLQQIRHLAPKAIVIGPGPGRPEQAGISLAVIEAFAGIIPILGICLGHQAIGQAFHAKITQAGEIMHGRVSDVYHQQQGVFVDLPNPCQVTRYHSLVIDKSSLPDCLEITAWTKKTVIDDGVAKTTVDEVMAVRHRYLPIEGVQFHPESILSSAGHQLLHNFLWQHQLTTQPFEPLS